ncbi:MAG: glycosyltransferase family 2 protein, partial [Patescibacteria group bacterium]
MKTSILIPAFNGFSYLKKHLPVITRLGADQIIIVDDASTDGTGQFLKTEYPNIVVITHPKNLRFPKSVNDGFAHATGEVVILLNQDLLPSPDLLKHALSHFKDPDIFAVTFAERQRSWADGAWNDGFLEFKNGARDE